jgi:hypothetical protein
MLEQLDNSSIVKSDEVYKPNQLFKAGKWTKLPHADMMKDEGIIVPTISRLDGEGNQAEKRSMRVQYDRAYVIQKVARDLRLLVKEMNAEQWEDFMYDVYVAAHPELKP